MSQFDFNAEEVTPSTGFTPIPAGKYLAVINNSELKDSKSGGRYLSLEFEIIKGEFNGRKLWTNLNLVHSNQKAVEIARAELSAICHAVGVLKFNDSVQLHNLPLMITVGLRKDRETDEMRNDIKGYASKASAATQPAATTTTPPWGR